MKKYHFPLIIMALLAILVVFVAHQSKQQTTAPPSALARKSASGPPAQHAPEADQTHVVKPPSVPGKQPAIPPLATIAQPIQPRKSQSLGGRFQFLTGPKEGDPLTIALDYIREPKKQGAFTEDDYKDPKITNQYVSKHNGVTHIYLRQRHQGLEVYGADIGVNVMPDGSIINLHNRFVGNVASGINTTVPSLDASEAIRSAATFYELGEADDLTPLAVSEVDPVAKNQLFSPAGISLDPIPAKLNLVPVAKGETRLAWNMVIRFNDHERWLDLNVDAVNGKVLSEANWIAGANYNVYPVPLESPSDGGRSVVVDPQDTSASPFGWHDTNGAAGAEFTDTRGNNVFAQEDADNNNTGGTRPDGTASLNFNFALDLNQAPTTYTSAATANLFYWNNLIHDIFYQYGFDEVSGNFQENNYGNGGAASDPVDADSQDGSGTNNANFGTPPDGSNPRMQMYVWTYTTPSRDSSLDNGVIIHEYGHGISNRLTGGPANSSALNANQSRGMGEGWSDFFALALTHQSGDTGSAGRGIGTYVLGQPSTGAGIRPYRYSTDMGINPHTFEDIGAVAIPHGVGSVWCAILNEVYWALIDDHGYDPDLYTGTGGNNLALQLVLDGMKLQPVTPTLLEARDAIIAADQVLTGGANYNTLWTAFAKRGMGASASDNGDPNSVVVTEAFDVPDDLMVDPAGGSPFLAGGPVGGPFNPTSQTYTLTNAGATPIDWTATVDVGWIDLNYTSVAGTLAAGDSTVMEAALNSAANALGVGTHIGTITFTNTNSGATIERIVNLSINNLTAALDSPGIFYVTSGNANWFSQTTTTHDGVDAGQAGLITHSQSSSVEATLVGPGTLTFWEKVSSESGWDYLEVYLEGVLSHRISGAVNWQQRTIAIPSGTHVVKWSYTKDDSVNSGSDTAWIDEVAYTPSAPMAPNNLMASDGTFGNKVHISWDASSGATSYRVFRNQAGSPLEPLSTWQPGLSFEDLTAEPGVTYYYRVRAARRSGETVVVSSMSATDSGFRVGTPSSIDASDGVYATNVRIVWGVARGATHYRVYRKSAESSLLPISPWQTTRLFSDVTAVPGETYFYRILAAYNDGSGMSTSQLGSTDSGFRTGIPTNVEATDELPTNRVRITWAAANGATHYRVYRKPADNSGPLIALGDWQTSRLFEDYSALSGVLYYYRIRAAHDSGSTFSVTDFSSPDAGHRGALNAIAMAAEASLPEDEDAKDTHALDQIEYETWISEFSDIPADKQGRLDDADGDGTSNIMERFHGTSPVDPNESGGIIVSSGPPIKIHLKIGKDTPPNVGEILWSSDLINWQSNGDLTNGTKVILSEVVLDDSHPEYDVVEITAGVSLGAPENLHFRLEVDTTKL